MSYTVITGANGFIAQHIIKILLSNGHKVIGTVRTQEKADTIAKLFDNENLILEIVPDLNAVDAFDPLFKKYNTQIKYVLHTASPVDLAVTDVQNGIIDPAINGTLSVFKAIKKYAADSVESVVYTSSSVAGANLKTIFDGTAIINEESWNPDGREDAVDSLSAYSVSKKLAEQAIWKFKEDNKDAIKFRLSTINPFFVTGPQAFDETAKGKLNETASYFEHILASKPGGDLAPFFGVPALDVRDLARAHYLALTESRFDGQRIFLDGDVYSTQQWYDVIHEKFPELNGKIAKGQPGTDKFKEGSIAKIDFSKSKKLLGFDQIPLKQTITDGIGQLLRVRGIPQN